MATIGGGTGNDIMSTESALNAGDYYNALAGNDSITAKGGNDTLNGGLGADTMIGGAGNDVYYVDDAGDILTEVAGEGTDTVIVSVLTAFTLDNEFENLTLTGVTVTGTGNGANNIITGNGTLANTIDGGSGDDSILGSTLNDSLDGGLGSGADTLNGGTGNDTLTGGGGNDTYLIDSASDVITETSNGGEDTVVVSTLVSYTLAQFFENLTLTGATTIGTGTSDDNVITDNTAGASSIDAGDGRDEIVSGAGNDTIVGGLDVDSMAGGAGNDVYFVDSISDYVKEWVGVGYGTEIDDRCRRLGHAPHNRGEHVFTGRQNARLCRECRSGDRG